MKKLIAIAFIILCVEKNFAQSELSLSGGMSFPAGDFANTTGGGAKIGFLGDLLFQHQVQEKNKLWLAGLIRFQSNKVDISHFEQLFPSAQISSSNWEASSFLIGPVMKFDLAETISLEPRILIGYMTAKSPNVTVTTGGISVSAESVRGGAFATLIGTSFKFKTSNNMSIVAGIDYLAANPTFNVTASSGSVSMSEKSSQPISSFNLLFGLCFKLK